MLAQGLVAISALLDIGLTRSLLYYQSKYASAINQRVSLINGAQGLVVLITTVVTFITILISLGLDVLIDLPETYWALCITVLASLVFVLFTLVCTTVVEAAGRFSAIAKFRCFSALLTYAVPRSLYVFVGDGDSFKYLLGGLFLAKIVAALTAWWMAGFSIFVNPFRNWRESALLFRYGRWVGLSNALGIGFTQFDRVILTAASNLTVLASYIPFSDLVQKASMLSNSLFKILFVTSIKSSKSVRKQLEKRTLLLIASLLLPIIVICLNAEWIITIWLGEGYLVNGTVVFQILVASLWVRLFAQYYVNKLYEEKRAHLVTANHLIEIVPYLGLLVIGAIEFGEVGVAGVVLIREVVDALLSWFRLDKVRRSFAA